MRKELIFQNSMKISSCLFVTAFSALVSPAFAADVVSEKDNMSIHETLQSKTVTGVVVDAAGVPVIGANVIVKGTTVGTITDFDGNYSLEVPENAVLQISYIGYLTEEVTVGDKSSINPKIRKQSQWQSQLQ